MLNALGGLLYKRRLTCYGIIIEDTSSGITTGRHLKTEVMFRLLETVVLGLLASLWLVQGQVPGTVRVGDYDVLRNTSVGPIVCAMDQPQLVRNDARSRLHCSTTCLQNDQCSSFNVKNVSSSASSFICEHFDGFPSNFTVDADCRHYAVSAQHHYYKT